MAIRRVRSRRRSGWLDAHILALIDCATTPLSGCAIAARSRSDGTAIHLSVIYRSLARLHAQRLIKRIELVNGYIRSRNAIMAEAVCERCGSLVAVPLGDPLVALERHVQIRGFAADCYVIEVSGLCPTCTIPCCTISAPTRR